MINFKSLYDLSLAKINLNAEFGQDEDGNNSMIETGEEEEKSSKLITRRFIG